MKSSVSADLVESANALISHASKVMLKILQARLQQYMNREFPEFKLDLEKGEEPEIKLPTSAGSWKKQESSRKTSISALAFDCVDHNKLWKILKEMGIPDHLTCLLRNLCRSGSNSSNWTWNYRLVPNRERSMSRLYLVTLLI